MNTSAIAQDMQPQRSHSAGEIGFDDLVEAYFSERKWRTAAPAVYVYFSKRRLMLEKVFDCRLSGEESDVPKSVTLAKIDPELIEDRRAVASIALTCLELSGKRYGPFSHYMEGCPGPLEGALLQNHHQVANDARDALERHYRTVFRDALALLFPDAVSRTSSERELMMMGLPAQPNLERYAAYITR
ncbi:MAG: hypothetical protein ABW217_23335 [Polyangiaceae bacterium]